ncbi:exod protein [Alphaproteobacteria bacterium]|nr:exod protein [Alphaproteobacteria bacterium]
MDQKKIITTQIIEDLVNKSSTDKVLVGDIVDSMEAIGFGLALMIFSLGIIIPLPPPFPSIISLPLVVFSAQMTIGMNSPKLPKWIARKEVKRSVLAMMVQKSSPYIRKVERVLKPRLTFMSSIVAERIVGLFLLGFSSFILVPLPLSNFIPGLGILITSFGLMGKDGLVIILGIVIGLMGVAISISTVFIGLEAFYMIKDFFFNLIS